MDLLYKPYGRKPTNRKENNFTLNVFRLYSSAHIINEKQIDEDLNVIIIIIGIYIEEIETSKLIDYLLSQRIYRFSIVRVS